MLAIFPLGVYVTEVDSLPKYQDLIGPLLLVLSEAGRPLTNSEIEEAVISKLDIPRSLADVIHSGNRTVLQYRLAWARTKAKTMGKIVSPSRETWTIKAS